MPIYYDIKPETNLLVYICIGTCTASEFFETADLVNLDQRRRNGMNVIVDILTADMDVEVKDLHFTIAMHRKLMQQGLALDATVFLTRSSSLRILGDALTLLSVDTPLNFAIFPDIHKAIHWLGLPEHESEVILFWNTTRANASGRNFENVFEP